MFRPPDQRLFKKSRTRVPSRDRRWRSVTWAKRTGIGYNTRVHGRCLSRDRGALIVLTEGGPRTVPGDAEPGDLVEIVDGRARVLVRGRPGGEASRVLAPR